MNNLIKPSVFDIIYKVMKEGYQRSSRKQTEKGIVINRKASEILMVGFDICPLWVAMSFV